jgi:hypothetical protein
VATNKHVIVANSSSFFILSELHFLTPPCGCPCFDNDARLGAFTQALMFISPILLDANQLVSGC